jgi:hypothetical protein
MHIQFSIREWKPEMKNKTEIGNEIFLQLNCLQIA